MAWAFEEMSARPFYLTGKPEEDVEEFVILLSKHAAAKTLQVPLSNVRAALAEVRFNCLLLFHAYG